MSSGWYHHFASALQDALDEEGVGVLQEFSPLPDGPRLDFFIPSFPRTVIEIKAVKARQYAHVHIYDNMLDQVKEMRKRLLSDDESIFVPELDIIILVIFVDDEKGDIGYRTLVNERDGITVLEIHGTPAFKDIESARGTAEIVNRCIRKIREKRIAPILIEVAQCEIPKWQRAHPSVGKLIESIKEHGILQPLIVKEENDGKFSVIDGGGRLLAAKELNLGLVPAIVYAKNLNQFWDEITIESDNFQKEIRADLEPILTLIEDVAVREVIEHEFIQLCKEYEEEHFTSCGLRIGRLLEYLIYGLAMVWEVPLNEPRLRGLKLIDDRAKELKRVYLEYCDLPDGPEKDQKFDTIQSRLNSISGELLKLQMEIKMSDTEQMEQGPRNVRAILSDIYQRYKDNQIVRDQFNGKELKKLVQSLSEFRNNAAHASITMESRELNREHIQEMGRILRTLMFKLSTIGHAISTH